MKAGLLFTLVGAAALTAAIFVQAVFYGGDFPAMPTFVIPGAAAMATGVLLVGLAVLTLAPRCVGGLLVSGAVAFLAANDQDARVMLYIPFGLARFALGRVLWSGTAFRPAFRSLAGRSG
jgi:hypothetical protein